MEGPIWFGVALSPATLAVIPFGMVIAGLVVAPWLGYGASLTGPSTGPSDGVFRPEGKK